MAVLAVSGQELSEAIEQAFPDVVEEIDHSAVWVRSDRVASVASFLRDDPELDFGFLNSISAVDYVEYFEVVYHLTSISRQCSALFKARLHGREDLSLPSVYSVWRGADFQEREIWDLMGIHFDGHPNMKRIMLWEGFDGHPLRKDFL